MTRAIKFQSGKYSVLRYSVRDWYLAKTRRDVLEKKGKRGEDRTEGRKIVARERVKDWPYFRLRIINVTTLALLLASASSDGYNRSKIRANSHPRGICRRELR